MNARLLGRVKLAPGIPGVEALGVRTLADFFADPPRIETGDRVVRDGDAWRFPLPGTVDEHGRQHESPRGAGTGWLRLERFANGGVESWRARLTHPRSFSVAARHWNLACHLQAHGLTTPQLVALGEGFESAAGQQSCLITRELDDFVPVAQWLASEQRRAERRRGLRSIGLALKQLLRCGAWLPRTNLDNLMIQSESDDCVALKITNLRSEQELSKELGIVRARMPAVAFTEFARGRILPKISSRRRTELVRALEHAARAHLSVRERRELVVTLTDSHAEARELARGCR